MINKSVTLIIMTFLLTGCFQQLRVNSFKKQLQGFDADAELIQWVEKNQIQSPTEAWTKLAYPAEMVWLATQPGLGATLDPTKIRLFIDDYAEHSLPMYEKEYPEEKRLRHALEIARKYADGKAPKDDLLPTARVVAEAIAEASANANYKKAKAARADARAAEAENLANIAANNANDAAAILNNVNGAYMAWNAADVIANAQAQYNQAQALSDASSQGYEDLRSRAATSEAKAAIARDALTGAVIVAMAVAMDNTQNPINEVGAACNKDDSNVQAWQADRLRYYFPNPFNQTVQLLGKSNQ